MTKIKNNLKKFRTLSGLSQEEVAKAIEVSRTYYSKLENCKHALCGKRLEKACEFFKTNIGQMIYINNKPVIKIEINLKCTVCNYNEKKEVELPFEITDVCNCPKCKEEGSVYIDSITDIPEVL